MALAYSEFDWATGTIIAGIKQAILASSDWSHLQLTTGTAATTLAGAASIGATSVSTAATIPSGSYIVIGNGAATPEVRLTTGVTGSGPYTVSFSEPLVRAYSSSQGVGVGSYVKATTTRGAQIVLDLNNVAPSTQNINVMAYATHDGTTAGQGSGARVLWWKRGSGSNTYPLHCRVSAHKDGLYIDIEGPRAGETGADSSNGSFRAPLYIGDIAPYDVTDPSPAVAFVAAYGAADTSQKIVVSRNRAGGAYWVSAMLRTLAYPQWGQAYPGNNPANAANGDYVQSPYVVFEAADGIRGRLQYLHYAGITGATGDAATGEPNAPIPGTEMIYGGFKYKAIVPFRTDGTANWHMSYGFAYVGNYQAPLLSPMLWVPSAVYP